MCATWMASDWKWLKQIRIGKVVTIEILTAQTYACRQIHEIVIFLQYLHHVLKGPGAQVLSYVGFILLAVHHQMADQQTNIAGQHRVLHVVTSPLQYWNNWK